MARYRIVQRPHKLDRQRPIFCVEARVWFWWKHVSKEATLAAAEKRVLELQEPVETKVIKEYN